MRKKIDLTGQRFGRLTVLREGKGRVYKCGVKHTTWICKCDCGNIKEVYGGWLKGRGTKSCGCINKEKITDLTGKRFGRLNVIERATEYRQITYKCICDCGNTAFVSKSNLEHGNTKSCGCLRKELPIKNLRKYDFQDTNITKLNDTLLKNNTTGVKGVYFDKERGKYRAYIEINKKRHRLGRYNTLEEAAQARKRAEEELWQPVIEEYEEEVKNEEL